jgi:hypothetical protein
MATVIAAHHVISPSISLIMEYSGSPVRERDQDNPQRTDQDNR